MIRDNIHGLLLAFLATSCAITTALCQHSETPPNIVLIVIDDIGYGDLGIYGNEIHQTPNIDQLAREGMIFTDFHSNGAVCSPTRAALMTGQYQQRTNIEHAIGFTMEEGMPLYKKTIPEYLSEAGYVSAVFGKWHLGHVSLFGPNDQGFDVSYTSNNTPDYHTHISRTGEIDWFKDQELKDEPGYLTDLVTKHSVDFIKDSRNQPFFLFISHIAAHFPFQGPDDPAHRTEGKVWHQSKYGPLPESEYRRAYTDMIEAVDESVGEVVQALKEAGLRDNTLIFITSDNGAYSWVGSNYPFRGEKGSLFEGGHRLPAIAHWPGHIAAGTVCHETVMTMDLAPTFVALAGLSVDPQNGDPFDGVDISGVLLNEDRLKERPLFWHFKNPYTNSFAYAVRDKEWKLLLEGEIRYLFNLRMDATERTNLMQQYSDRAEGMEGLYKEWERGVFRD